MMKREHAINNSQGKARAVFTAVLLGLAMFCGAAYAACIDPVGAEGDQIYNQDHAMMQFCNGTDWIAMSDMGDSGSGGGGGACTTLPTCYEGASVISDGTGWVCEAPVVPVEFVYNGWTGDAASYYTSRVYSNIPIGTADAERYVVIFVTHNKTTTNSYVSQVQFDGVDATYLGKAGMGGASGAEFAISAWGLLKPTGTTMNVTVYPTGQALGHDIISGSFLQYDGSYSLTAVGGDDANSAGGAGGSVNINVDSSGALVCGGYDNIDATAMVISGATFTEILNLDSGNSERIGLWSAGDLTTETNKAIGLSGGGYTELLCLSAL